MNLNEFFNTALSSPFGTVQAVRSMSAPRRTPEEIERRNAKTREQADKLILSKMSVNDNLSSVYIPLILVDNASIIIEAIRNVLVQTAQASRTLLYKFGKAEAMETLTKDIKSNLERYEHRLHEELDDKRVTLKYSAEEFYDTMVKTYATIIKYAEEELARMYPNSDAGTRHLVATCHLVKIMLEYKDDYETKSCKKMQEYLKGTTLLLSRKSPVWQERMMEHVIRVIKLMEMPTEISSEQLSLYKRVMADKIEKIDMEKLTDRAVKRRVESMNQ